MHPIYPRLDSAGGGGGASRTVSLRKSTDIDSTTQPPLDFHVHVIRDAPSGNQPDLRLAEHGRCVEYCSVRDAASQERRGKRPMGSVTSNQSTPRVAPWRGRGGQGVGAAWCGNSRVWEQDVASAGSRGRLCWEASGCGQASRRDTGVHRSGRWQGAELRQAVGWEIVSWLRRQQYAGTFRVWQQGLTEC